MKNGLGNIMFEEEISKNVMSTLNKVLDIRIMTDYNSFYNASHNKYQNSRSLAR